MDPEMTLGIYRKRIPSQLSDKTKVALEFHPYLVPHPNSRVKKMRASYGV